MTMTPELLFAILAMDSYNRGYDPGIAGLSDATGTQVGPASIKHNLEDFDLDQSAIAAGFYAISYDTPYGVVISYRGTDNPILLSTETAVSDLWTGWISALGVPTSQTGLALQFYNAVTNSTYEAGPAANTILTGHSLGGFR
jgi:hypothetical protein